MDEWLADFNAAAYWKARWEEMQVIAEEAQEAAANYHRAWTDAVALAEGLEARTQQSPSG